MDIQTIAPPIPAPLRYPCHAKHGGGGPRDVVHSGKGVLGREPLGANVPCVRRCPSLCSSAHSPVFPAEVLRFHRPEL